MFIKKILIPTDFSACAADAAEVGIQLAKRAQAEIHFLHLSAKAESQRHVPSQTGTGSSPKVGTEQNALNELVRRAEKEGVKAFPVLVLNAGNQDITDYVSPFNIDFIVMGSHGATGIRDLVIGSHTQKVVRKSSVSVLVVKHKPAHIDFKNILFASRFNEALDEALKQLVEFSALWNANLHLLYVNVITDLVQQSEARLIMEKHASKFTGKVVSENIADTNDAEFGISKFARQLKADMIALTTHERTGMIKLFSSSIAERLVNHEHIPVLVMISKK